MKAVAAESETEHAAAVSAGVESAGVESSGVESAVVELFGAAIAGAVNDSPKGVAQKDDFLHHPAEPERAGLPVPAHLRAEWSVRVSVSVS